MKPSNIVLGATAPPADVFALALALGEALAALADESQPALAA